MFGSFQTEKLPGSGFGMRLVLKEARFPPQIWSVYDRVINQDPLTNNFLEGWHRRFSSIVDVHHPDIYKLLSKLTGEQAHTEMSRREILRGEDPSPSKKAVISRNNFRYFFRYFFDIISIFFRCFSMFFFDIFFRLKVNSIFCLIRCVDV